MRRQAGPCARVDRDIAARQAQNGAVARRHMAQVPVAWSLHALNERLSGFESGWLTWTMDKVQDLNQGHSAVFEVWRHKCARARRACWAGPCLQSALLVWLEALREVCTAPH